MYLVPILSNALDIMELLQQSKASYSLEEIHARTGIAKSTAFRLLKTLVHRGYIAKFENGKYRSLTRPSKLRFGYASMCEALPFPAAVTESLKKAAQASGIELFVLDNNFDAETAIANAERFIAENVDLVIEFQAHQHSAAHIAHRLSQAAIPLIAVDIPHPRSIFVGVDNYQIGYAAGKLLAAHAREHWRGRADIFLGLNLDQAGPLVGSRISAALRAVQTELGDGAAAMNVIMRDSRGLAADSDAITADVLSRAPKAKRILIATTSDSSALGAVQAVRRLRRSQHVAVASQDCVTEAIAEMSRPDSPLIGSISHEAHTYGERLIQVGLALLKNEHVGPYYFVDHRVVTQPMARDTTASTVLAPGLTGPAVPRERRRAGGGA
jgi:ribose transport system substrate-binding protein